MPITHPIRGLIFDFDGLILDTESPWFHAWQELYEQHGCVLDEESWMLMVGGSGFEMDPFKSLEEQLGRPVDRAALDARGEVREMELRAMQEILPGVLAYLDDAARLGLGTAIASNSRHEWVEPDLERLGIRDRFQHIICREDAENFKPHPEIYQRALDALGIQPTEAIALEDSSTGVSAAKAAGIFCVAVPNAMTHRMPLEHADLKLTSLNDMPLEELLVHARAPVRP